MSPQSEIEWHQEEIERHERRIIVLKQDITSTLKSMKRERTRRDKLKAHAEAQIRDSDRLLSGLHDELAEIEAEKRNLEESIVGSEQAIKRHNESLRQR